MIRTIVKLGLFTAVCLGFTAYLGLTIGNITLFQDTYELEATFDDATGLLVDDNVKVAGVKVGKVTGVEVDKGRARVTMQVRDGVALPADTTAGIRWRNLLGQRYIYLYPGTAGTKLTDGDRIERTEDVVDIGELFNRLGPVVAAIDPDKVNVFLDEIVVALDGNQANVKAVLAHLATLTQGLATRDATIGRLIGDLDTLMATLNTRDGQIRTLLDNLVTLSSTFSANADVVEAAIDELGPLSADLDDLLSTRAAEIDATLANLVTVLETVRTKLPELDRALGGLGDAAAAIYRSAGYGEWLNQVIYCGEFHPPPEEGPPCAAASAPAASPARAPSTGADAVRDLLGYGS